MSQINSTTNSTTTSSGEQHYYYTFLWITTIGLGIIGAWFAHNYIHQVTASPEYASVYSTSYNESIDRGKLWVIVLLYLYFKTLSDGIKRERHLSTFVKLTIWSVVVLFAKLSAVHAVTGSAGTPLSAYFAGATAHVDYVVTFGMLIFPIASIYMIIEFIRFKGKKSRVKL